MSDPVFISYRQIDDDQRSRVRAFAEKLRAAGIKVILDQFYLDAHPGGPPNGWDKWSSDCALKTEFVLIIGTPAWFACFEKTQPPGTGLGAACEADDLRHRIYQAGGTIENIRVAVFDDADATDIPAKLARYHRFHITRDLQNIIRWLGGTPPAPAPPPGIVPATAIPHNLPRLQPFFGREDELKKIAAALDPEDRTWGALIDGPGGMGKTSLAVRAAYDAPAAHFDAIHFVSLKSRELDDDGIRDLSGFLISGLAELLNELACLLGREDIPRAPEAERPRLLLEALRGTRALLLLDNLESLTKPERDTLFTFIKRLPPGCKAILTARGRIGSGAEELILERLSQEAALDTLAELATRNPTLAATSEAERIALYEQTTGSPLLLRWTAGQLGRGHCLTLEHAITYLRSCPPGNDPLEFIFGDLAEDFSPEETKAVCALTYFTLPARVEHLAPIAMLAESDAELALRSLANRSLVVPSIEHLTFSLVPMVADFLRKKRPQVVHQTGLLLEAHAYEFILDNGFTEHERFPAIEMAWPCVAAALPLFLAGDQERLQMVCMALTHFLNGQGLWDEWLALCEKAEARAVEVKEYYWAGWRAFNTGFIHFLRQHADAVMDCAQRAKAYWDQSVDTTSSERAYAIGLRGKGYQLKMDYPAAIAAFHEALNTLDPSITVESEEVAVGLTALAEAEHLSGDITASETHYREALRIARLKGITELIATATGNLAALALDRKEWAAAGELASEALRLSEASHRRELIAQDSHRLAEALVRQSRAAEALPHARQAVEIFEKLRHPNLGDARAILAECEAGVAGA